MKPDTQIKIQEMETLLRLARRLRKCAEYVSPDTVQVVLETFDTSKGSGRKVKLEFLHEMKTKVNRVPIEILREKLVTALNDAANTAESLADELLDGVKEQDDGMP